MFSLLQHNLNLIYMFVYIIERKYTSSINFKWDYDKLKIITIVYYNQMLTKKKFMGVLLPLDFFSWFRNKKKMYTNLYLNC